MSGRARAGNAKKEIRVSIKHMIFKCVEVAAAWHDDLENLSPKTTMTERIPASTLITTFVESKVIDVLQLVGPEWYG